MRILHFSDVHLNPKEKDSTKKLVDKMIRAITKDYGDHPAFDIVIFSGDMILSGGRDNMNNLLFEVKDGFNGFEEVVINPICAAFNLPKERFIVTIGNHDVDWVKAPKVRQKEIKNLKSDSEIRSFYHKYISTEKALWIKEFNSFREKLYAGATNYKSNAAYANVILPIDGHSVGISILNSAWGSLPGSKIVLLEREQLSESSEYLEDNDCDYKICVMHNPLQCFSEEEQIPIQKILLENYDACFTGHTHRQNDYKIERERKKCYLSVSQKFRSTDWDTTEHDSRYKNGFVVFEDNGTCFAITPYWYNEELEQFEQNEKKETQKETPRNIHKIDALFAQKNVLRVKDFEFLRNNALDKIIDNIVKEEHQFIRLSALSGFGKTRLLYEAFLPNRTNLSSPSSNAYYCNTYPDDEIVFREIESIVENNSTKQGFIILDNCNWMLMRKVIEYMSVQKTQMRLIGVDNNPYEGSELEQCYSIIIPPDIIKDKVDKYIDDALSQVIYHELKEDVKKLADGYPYMAYRLIETCRKKGSVSIANIDYLVRDMLRVKGVDESNENQRMLQAMALFQPMPTRRGDKDAFDFILNNQSITHLKDGDEYYRKDVFNKVLKRYSPILIDQSADWIIVRPYPLAIWLIQQWFEVMDDESKLEKLADDIKSQSPRVSKLLTNSICRRIEGMQESIPAKTLIEKLVQPDSGSFCSEKVVCSEMGSRLFLAMATVNPEKVANCLKYIFRNKTTDWIRDNIKDDIRRNLVYTLNKLCFANESYDDAVLVMAQFAKAENEHWSNNSKYGLTQLFPVFLPDTEVNLEKRVHTIEKLWDIGYKDFAISAINVAFKNGNFTRMCGAEKFGWHHRESYTPETWNEVFDYWKKCKELLLSWYEKDDSIINDVRDLVEKHVHDWRSATLMNEYLFPLIDIIAPKFNWQWNKMYELLIQLLRFHDSEYSIEQKSKLNEYIDKLKPTLFADTLTYTERKIFDKDSNDRTYEEVAHELMHPLVELFINERIYDNIKEVEALVDMQNGDGFFIKELKPYLTDSVLATFLGNVWHIVEVRGDNFFSSNFVSGMIRACCQSPAVQQYISDLWEKGYKTVYVRVMAAIEDDNMNSYQQLVLLFNKHLISYEHISLYLTSLWGLTNAQMHILLPSLLDNFSDKKNDILKFVMKHRYWTKVLDDELLHKHIRRLLIDCPLVDEQKRVNHEQVEVIKEYLIKYKNTDIDFGIQINKKIIEVLGDSFIHDDILSDLYSELLQEPYQQAILDDFMDALTNNILFYMQVQYEIGSGFSFGVGPLFQYVSSEKLKYYCEKNVKIRHMLANMAPVFTPNDNNPRAGFSDFIQWLIEKYGNDEQSGVLSGISANMRTMSWTGTPIPLYEDMIRIFTPYTTHSYTAVQKWAQQEINQLNQSIAQEKSRDDFMRMHDA